MRVVSSRDSSFLSNVNCIILVLQQYSKCGVDPFAALLPLSRPTERSHDRPLNSLPSAVNSCPQQLPPWELPDLLPSLLKPRPFVITKPLDFLEEVPLLMLTMPMSEFT